MIFHKRDWAMKKLKKKVALVTGAARGIGEAIARAFVNEGAYVYLSDINVQLGADTATKLGKSAKYIHLDVRKEKNWASVTKYLLDTHGGIDIIVNNAGITGFENGNMVQDPENTSLSAWRSIHETNLDGVFLGCKYAIKAMRPKKAGSIINISSRSGLVGVPGAVAYASSKAAVRNHTKSVALYLAEQDLKIRCNSIHPAAIFTPMWEPMLGTGPDRAARMAEFVSDTPLRRFGLPEEVAALVTLLASDEATYITGSEFNMDGGLMAGTFVSRRTST